MAHCGIEKTIQGNGSNYWFPTLRKKVRNYIDNCVTCLMANSAVNFCEGEMQITDSPLFLMETIHVNHIGPLTYSLNNFKHVLVIIDAFSRHAWLFPVKSTTSKEAIKNLSFLFQNITSPSKLISDRGNAFTTQEFANFLNEYKVTHHQIAVAAAWANGLIERINRFIKFSLRKIVEDQTN